MTGASRWTVLRTQKAVEFGIWSSRRGREFGIWSESAAGNSVFGRVGAAGNSVLAPGGNTSAAGTSTTFAVLFKTYYDLKPTTGLKLTSLEEQRRWRAGSLRSSRKGTPVCSQKAERAACSPRRTRSICPQGGLSGSQASMV
jgi:hypothetical protein